MAKILGISESTLAAWEKPNSVLQRRINIVVKLCEVLRCSHLGYLLTSYSFGERHSSSPAEVNEDVDRLFLSGTTSINRSLLDRSPEFGPPINCELSQHGDAANQLKEKLLEAKLYCKEFIREGYIYPSDNGKDLVDCRAPRKISWSDLNVRS